jgi:hypothetical protein
MKLAKPYFDGAKELISHGNGEQERIQVTS